MVAPSAHAAFRVVGTVNAPGVRVEPRPCRPALVRLPACRQGGGRRCVRRFPNSLPVFVGGVARDWIRPAGPASGSGQRVRPQRNKHTDKSGSRSTVRRQQCRRAAAQPILISARPRHRPRNGPPGEPHPNADAPTHFPARIVAFIPDGVRLPPPCPFTWQALICRSSAEEEAERQQARQREKRRAFVVDQ